MEEELKYLESKIENLDFLISNSYKHIEGINDDDIIYLINEHKNEKRILLNIEARLKGHKRKSKVIKLKL